VETIKSGWPVCGSCCEVAWFSWMGGPHHCVVAEPEEELHDFAIACRYGDLSRLGAQVAESLPSVPSVGPTTPLTSAGMNDIQRTALSDLCRILGVRFEDSDYFIYPETSSLMAGWAEGWIGGNDGRKLYVGCDPRTGQIHS
jgi:hypothetical protein